MNKDDKRRLEVTVYRIEKDFGKKSNAYRVSKRVLDHEVDFYHCNVTLDPKGLHIWCSCPGFHHQKFPKDEHKHVRIMMHYRALGEPEYAEYRFRGTGRNTIITHEGEVI